MTYRTLSLQCHCGRPSASIREVGFTSDHQLVLHWRCPDCKAYVYGLKPLNDCFQVCPTQEEAEEDSTDLSKLSETAIREMDAKFLQELGVKLPDCAEL
ncbi:MAG: hypothetical protein LAP40_20590 [Acidobacteriia bacterium]|nr:hypothetical protein [Terriglobia bacterium]